MRGVGRDGWWQDASPAKVAHAAANLREHRGRSLLARFLYWRLKRQCDKRFGVDLDRTFDTFGPQAPNREQAIQRLDHGIQNLRGQNSQEAQAISQLQDQRAQMSLNQDFRNQQFVLVPVPVQVFNPWLDPALVHSVRDRIPQQSQEEQRVEDAEVGEPEAEVEGSEVEGSEAEAEDAEVGEPEAEVEGSEVEGSEAEAEDAEVGEPEAEVEGSEVEGAEVEGSEVKGSEVGEPEAEAEGAEVEGSEAEAEDAEVEEPEAEVEGAEVEGSEVKGSEVGEPEAEAEGAEVEDAGSEAEGSEVEGPEQEQGEQQVGETAASPDAGTPTPTQEKEGASTERPGPPEGKNDAGTLLTMGARGGDPTRGGSGAANGSPPRSSHLNTGRERLAGKSEGIGGR